MIQNINYKEYEVECDSCGDVEEFDADDFYELIEIIKVAGWRNKKIGGDWSNLCPSCASYRSNPFKTKGE